MLKVIGHYKAVCPYCGGLVQFLDVEGKKPRLTNFCRHFDRVYKDGFTKIMVRFSVFQDVEAVQD